MNKEVSNTRLLLDNESGSINTLSMLLCIVAIGAYLKGGQAALEQYLPPFLHLLLLIILGIITMFTIGCEVHVLLLGEKSAGQLRRELNRQTKRLRRFIKSSRDRISAVEQRTEFAAGLLRPAAYENLSHAKQVVNGLDRRVQKVRSMLETKKRRKIYEAAELMGATLSPFESCTDSLIDARPLPPLDSDQWIPTVEQLLSAVEFESVRAMSKRASKVA